MLISIALERCENVLVLPDNLPEQSYVICPTEDTNCWHILSTELNNQCLQKMAEAVPPSDRQRFQLMLQGSYQEVERQGNLLLLPENQTFRIPACIFILKLDK